MLWFRLSGVLWLRRAERAFLPLLFQLPPRSTRLSPLMARTRLTILHRVLPAAMRGSRFPKHYDAW